MLLISLYENLLLNTIPVLPQKLVEDIKTYNLALVVQKKIHLFPFTEICYINVNKIASPVYLPNKIKNEFQLANTLLNFLLKFIARCRWEVSMFSLGIPVFVAGVHKRRDRHSVPISGYICRITGFETAVSI